LKKLLLFVAVLLVLGGALIFAYLSPTVAFHNIETAVAANAVDTISDEIDQKSIIAHLRNQMSLAMQNALRSYAARPDPASTEARLAPYFDKRSAALATPAFILRELGAQLNGKVGEIEVRFTSLSEASVHWTSVNKSHEALLSRQGLVWKLGALDAPDAMPRYWDQPTILFGTYYPSHFENCCIGGKSSETPYSGLQLTTAIDILDVYPDALDMSNVTQVQIGNPDPEASFASMVSSLKYNDPIEVHCKQLWQGNTGHYALPVYCVTDEIKPAVLSRQ
jgi:Protein of unknown function (DUF2939)